MTSVTQATRSIEERLRALREAVSVYTGEQGVRRLVDASRLTLTSAISDFARTHNAHVERRVRALHDTRACIDELDDALDDVVFGVGSLVRKLARATAVLERLHTACADDDDADDNAAPVTRDEPYADVQPSQRRGVHDDDDDVAAARLRDLAVQVQRMRAAHIDLNSTHLTCKRLHSDTAAQLGDTASAASSRVSLAQNDYDIQRLRVLRRQADVMHVQQQQQNNNNDIDAQQQLRLAEFALQREQASEATLRRACDGIAAEALSRSGYALEQASMATWASANVFFAQLHTTLADCAAATHDVAVALADVKNAQRVSRQITREKRGGAAAAAVPALPSSSSSPVEATADVPTPVAANAVMDDLFA